MICSSICVLGGLKALEGLLGCSKFRWVGSSLVSFFNLRPKSFSGYCLLNSFYKSRRNKRICLLNDSDNQLNNDAFTSFNSIVPLFNAQHRISVTDNKGGFFKDSRMYSTSLNMTICLTNFQDIYSPYRNVTDLSWTW
jgi:hypothetical protein